MGVRSHDCIHPAVQIVAHRETFTRRFTVEIHEYFISLHLLQYGIRFFERAVDCRHETSALQIHDQELPAIYIHDSVSFPWGSFRIIGGPDHPDILIQYIIYLPLGKRMVDECNEIRTIAQYLFVNPLRYSFAMSGVFTIHYCEISSVFLLQVHQIFTQHSSADFTDYIPDK